MATDTSLVDLVVKQASEQIEKANVLVDRINAATSDDGKLVHDIRTDEATTDEKIRKFQTWLEAAQEKIEQATQEINNYIKSDLMPERENFDVEAAKSEYKEIRTAVKNALGYVATLPGYDAESVKVPDLKNLRGGSSTGGGTGGKRPRLASISVDGTLIEKSVEKDDGTKVGVSNFTLAAQHLSKQSGTKVEVKDLQAAAFAAANTDDLSTLNGSPFSFSFSAGEKNYDVAVVPAVKGGAEETEATPAE